MSDIFFDALLRAYRVARDTGDAEAAQKAFTDHLKGTDENPDDYRLDIQVGNRVRVKAVGNGRNTTLRQR